MTSKPGDVARPATGSASDRDTPPITPHPCPRCGEDPTSAEPITHCEWCGAEYDVPER